MQASLFDLFVAPPVPPAEEPPVPIAPSSSPIAKHCSSMGARKIEETRESIWQEMLWLYAAKPRTDAEIAHYLSCVFKREVAPSTISARRSELIKQGVIDPVPCGTRKNQRTGVSNSLWQLAHRTP